MQHICVCFVNILCTCFCWVHWCHAFCVYYCASCNPFPCTYDCNLIKQKPEISLPTKLLNKIHSSWAVNHGGGLWWPWHHLVTDVFLLGSAVGPWIFWVAYTKKCGWKCWVLCPFANGLHTRSGILLILITGRKINSK